MTKDRPHELALTDSGTLSPEQQAALGAIIQQLMTPVIEAMAGMMRRNSEALERLAAAQKVQSDRMEALEKQIRLNTLVTAQQVRFLNATIRERARELLPLHHAHQRRRDHASGRRRGGEAGGDGAGRAALGRRSRPPTPCHQRRAYLSGASAARPTQTGATSTGRRPGARPPDAANRRARYKLPCPAPRGAQGQADGQPGKPPGAQRTGATAQRGAILAACAPLWRFFRSLVISHASPHVRTPQNGEKSLDLGLVLCALIVLYLFGGV